MKFGCIYADFPWPEQGGGQVKRGADRHYPLQTPRQILHTADLLGEVVADDALGFFWVTNNYLPLGLDVLKAAGFRYVTNLAWVKAKPDAERPRVVQLEPAGLGQWTRGLHELCLFGVRGSPAYPRREDGGRVQPDTVLAAPRGEHSEKPPAMAEHVEAMTTHLGLRLEVFSRAPRPGWVSIGHGVDGCDVDVALGELAAGRIRAAWWP